MDFALAPDTVMLRDMLRRFVAKDARPLEMKYFNAGALTEAERAQLRAGVEQLGLWGLTVPERLGGGGIDTVTACVVAEELGRTFVPVEIGEVSPLLYACAGAQVERYLQPALAGDRRAILAAREPRARRPADLRPEAWTTTAAPAAGGYAITGHKLLATLPGPDDFFIVLARASAPAGVTAFLLEAGRPGLDVIANGRIELRLAGCAASAADVLGEPGRALSLAAGEAPRAWIITGARYLGLVERLADMAAEHARDWVALGAPLAVRPAIGRMLAELRVETESARWLIYHAAWSAGTGPAEAVGELALHVRLASGGLLQRAIDRATMIYTGPGPSAAIEPQRLARSAVPAEVLELSLESARASLAAGMLAASAGR